MKTRESFLLIVKAIDIAITNISGERISIRKAIINAICTMFMSVVIRVIIEPVENLSTLEKEKSWIFSKIPWRSSAPKPIPALDAKYAALAEKEGNVIFGGRLGAYKYYDMDKVIDAALTMLETL